MWLIVGLGNPGEEYTKTRHNIGFQCVNEVARRHGLDFSKKQSKARIAEGQIAGQRVALVKPFTFMNLIGQSVVGLCNWYKITPAERLLVIYDDLDLPFGALRLRERGSAGTHNGMKSIVGLLGSQEFPRIRFGIGQGRRARRGQLCAGAIHPRGAGPAPRDHHARGRRRRGGPARGLHHGDEPLQRGTGEMTR